MEIANLFKAYETLKSHRLDLGLLLDGGHSMQIHQQIERRNEEVIQTNPKQSANILAGNIDRQHSFLSGLVQQYQYEQQPRLDKGNDL